MLGSQVGLDDALVLHYLGRRSVGDDLAVIDHDHAVDDRHQLLQLVLDHQHRRAFRMQPAEAPALVQPTDGAGEEVGLGRVQAAERLVEQQQLGLGGDGARDLEALEIALRERRGRLERHIGDADELERVHRFRLDALHPLAAAPRARRHQRHHDVGDDRQVAEGAHVLEGAGNAAVDDVPGREPGDVLAVEDDAPGVGAQDLGDQAQQRSFARAVGADQADQLVALELEAHRVHSSQAAEALGDLLDSEEFRRHDVVCRFVPAAILTQHTKIPAMDDKFLEQMDTQLTGWPDPVARLRQAIEKDEFALYCQPILGLAAGGYPMGEVLVRMREEEQALLPPGDFLPVFEHYRMMPQLDRWGVRNTIMRLAAGSGSPCVPGNLSGQTLSDTEVSRFVGGELSKYKVSPDSLMFELDESDVLRHQDWAAQFAASFRSLGVRLLVAGFGRRAVSFSIFEALQVAFVKVDGSITRKLLANEAARNKMNAVLRVGEALGFLVIAECVEEQDVLIRLKALRVGYAQGFGIHQPHPIDKLAAA